MGKLCRLVDVGVCTCVNLISVWYTQVSVHILHLQEGKWSLQGNQTLFFQMCKGRVVVSQAVTALAGGTLLGWLWVLTGCAGLASAAAAVCERYRADSSFTEGAHSLPRPRCAVCLVLPAGSRNDRARSSGTGTDMCGEPQTAGQGQHPPKLNITLSWFREKTWIFPFPLVEPGWEWCFGPIAASLGKAITKHERVTGHGGATHIQLEPIPTFFCTPLLWVCLTSSYIHFSLLLPRRDEKGETWRCSRELLAEPSNSALNLEVWYFGLHHLPAGASVFKERSNSKM